MKTGRKITNGPRVYMATDTVCEKFRTPVIIEVVVEGFGTIDADALVDAVDAASRANPGTRLVARGKLHASRLIDKGITPPVRLVSDSGRQDSGAEGLAFNRHPLSIHSGPTCEVILISSPPTRIIFRGHHTVIDGQGLMMWILDVFRALRGETPIGSTWTESMDQFRRVSPVKEPKWSGGQCIAPTGRPRGRYNRMVYSHIDISGPVSNLMPRLILLASQAARERQPDGKIVFGVPISLRHRAPRIRSSSNLSRAVYLEVTPDTTVTDLHQSIHRYREFDGKPALTEVVIPFLPLWVLRKALENGYRKSSATGRYWVSGIVSNFGRCKTKQLSTPDFTASSVFSLPPSSVSTPLFFILIGLDDAISVSVSMPDVLASEGRLFDFMAHIKRGLCRGPVSDAPNHINDSHQKNFAHQRLSPAASDF